MSQRGCGKVEGEKLRRNGAWVRGCKGAAETARRCSWYNPGVTVIDLGRPILNECNRLLTATMSYAKSFTLTGHSVAHILSCATKVNGS
jgi:hypothetical protein